MLPQLTGGSIYDKMIEILNLWEINEREVLKIATDNAVNMLKVFRDNEDEIEPADVEEEDFDEEEGPLENEDKIKK